MSQFSIGSKTFVADSAIKRFARVKLKAGSGSLVEEAGEDENCIGIAEQKVEAGENVTVTFLTRGRTYRVLANEAFTAGSDLYASAGGRVQDTDPGSGTIFFKALGVANAQDDYVEVLSV